MAALVAFANDAPAAARGTRHECKPDGVPVGLAFQGEALQPIDYLGESRMLAADRSTKLENFRLISLRGEALEIGKLPWTVEPTRWFSRGQALYAIGSGRSQTEGKTDVVLVRWGIDSRPRLTKIASTSSVLAQPRAALIDEYLAIVWAEPGEGGAARAKVSFVDLEELRVREPLDLGPYAKGWLEVAPVERGFVAIWPAQQGVMRAAFDVHGKPQGATSTLAWKSPTKVRGAQACGSRVWLAHERSADEITLSASNPAGEIVEVARLAASPTEERLPMLCADDSVAVAHRTVNAKQGNVVFWLSTVDADGNVRERRVKDMQGAADAIRLMQLAAAGQARSAWWVEGSGPVAKLWSRAIVCDAR